MRVFLIALCACGSAATNAPAPPVATTVVAKKRVEPRAPVDVVASLSLPVTDTSWIAPGPAQLVLGGVSVQPLEGAARLEVNLLEEQGNDVRIGVRLDNARFALWTSRTRLLSMLNHDHRIELPGAFAFGADPMQVVLRAGAQVQRLAKKDGRTQVRYVGALEIEGWVPDELLVDRWPAGRENHGRVPTGRRTLMLLPGAVIRMEPKWAGMQLAVLNLGYFVDEIKALDDAWSEVSYEDGDLFVHGYVSKRDPPGRTHPQKAAEQTTPLTPNVTVLDGTCLYIENEEIGFLVGDQAAVVEKTTRPGWFSLTIDTPWGPIAFDAKGPAETELAKCGA